MNFSASTQRGSHISKENLPPSSKTDALPVQRAKQRTVLGVLSENEQRGRPFSQVSERGEVERMKCFFFFLFPIHSLPLTEHSHFNFLWQSLHFSPQGSQFSKRSSPSVTFLGGPSSSSYDVYVEEASEVVLAASGQEVLSGSYYLDNDTAALQNEDLRLLLELSSSEVWQRQNHLLCKICFLFYSKRRFTLVGSCHDASMQSNESLMSEEVQCFSEYAEDIHRHLRKSEVRNDLNFEH